jgi:hypothetical protein
MHTTNRMVISILIMININYNSLIIINIWYNAKTKKVKLLLFHINIFFIYKKIMYIYLSDFDYFLVMAKIFKKYS